MDNFSVGLLRFAALRRRCVFSMTLLLFANIELIEGVPTSEFIPFGHYTGDTRVRTQDDGSSGHIPIAISFPYFGSTYDGLWVNVNGGISFLEELSSLHSTVFPISAGIPVIAPYWTDINLWNGGSLWYREEISNQYNDNDIIINEVTEEIRSTAPEHQDFNATWLFIATWDNVAFYHASSSVGKSLRNTFQVVLVNGHSGPTTRSFAIFNYARLEWLTGEGDYDTGLGAAPALAGFDAGDGTYFAIDGSGTDRVRDLARTTNAGMPGKSIFKINSANITAASGLRHTPEHVPEIIEGVPTSEFIPFGSDHGDTIVASQDDGSSGNISIAVSFPYFGSKYDDLYVNVNGGISFLEELSAYTSTDFPMPAGIPVIVPYWTDIDTRWNGGSLSYRQETNQHILDQVTGEIRAAASTHQDFNATWVFVATWENVAFWGASSVGMSLRNNFQVVLAYDSGPKMSSFAIFNYARLEWTTGVASDGDEDTGLGGTPAMAGFDAGDNSTYFAIDGSRTGRVLDLVRKTNVGILGKWIFKIDSANVTSASDCGGVTCLHSDGVCVEDDHGDETCACDASTGRPQGDGALACFKRESIHGTIRSEPYIDTFDNKTYQFNLPCRYLVTKFTSELTTMTQEPFERVGACECQVYSWQRKHLGKFYPHGFDASCKIIRMDSEAIHYVSGFSIRKYGVAEYGLYNFVEEGVNQYLPDGPWGREDVSNTTDGIVTESKLDRMDNIARIHAKSCGLRVDFRPFDIAKGRYQTHPNGVAFSIDKDLVPKLIDNSRSMISGPRMHSGVPLYDQMGNTALTVEEFFLMRALTSDVVQNQPGFSQECSSLGESALMCDTDDSSKRAMDQCKWMLHSQAFIKCVDGDDPTADFLLYLVRRCFDQACGTLSSCGILSGSFRSDLSNIPADCRTTTMLNKVHKLNTWLMTDTFC